MILFFLLLATACALVKRIDYRIPFALIMAWMIATLSWINVTKLITGDWVWYTQHYLMYDNYSFEEYLNAKIGLIKIKWNEPVYYGLAMIVSSLSGGSVDALAITITVIDYGCISAAVLILGTKFYREIGKPPNPLLLASCCATAITFTLVTHLVRQEMATSIAILGAALLTVRRPFWAGLLAALAVMTHQSALLIVIILYAPIVTEYYLGRSPILKAAALALAAISLLVIGYLISHSDVAALGRDDDGAVSNVLIVADLLVLLGLLAIRPLMKKRSSQIATTTASFILFYITLSTMIGLPLAMLRLYFNVDFIRAFATFMLVAVLIPARTPRIVSTLVGLAMFLLSLTYINQRIERAPFTYGDTFINFLTYPVARG